MTSRYLASSYRGWPSVSLPTKPRFPFDAVERAPALVPRLDGTIVTYGPECYGSGRQADEAAVAGVGLVYGIGKVVAELVENLLDLGVVLARDMLPNEPLKAVRLRLAPMPDGRRPWEERETREGAVVFHPWPFPSPLIQHPAGSVWMANLLESPDLSLIVEFVVQGSLDAGIHG